MKGNRTSIRPSRRPSRYAWAAVITAATVLSGCSDKAAKQEQTAAVEAAAVRAEAAATRAEQAASRMAHANAANAAQNVDDPPVEDPSPTDEAVRAVVEHRDMPQPS